MGAFKNKILDELYENNYKDLYNTIDKIDNDVDVANYLASNKAYFSKNFKTKDLEGMPEFRNAIYSDIKSGIVNLDKEFGKDWDKNFANIPYDEIVFRAEKQGVNPKELLNTMAKEATARERKRIAHGEWNPNESVINNMKNELGGTALSLFGRRQQEAIERGEDPSAKDYIGDIGEQGLYMVPYGRAVAGLSNGGKIARLLSGVASNTVAPVATEVYDSQVYDNTNPRGNFSVADVAGGTAVNVTAPWAIRGGLLGAGRLVGNRAPVKKWVEYANSPSVKEVANEINKPYKKFTPSHSNNPSVSKAERQAAKEMNAVNSTNPDSYAAYINGVYYKIAKEPGATLQDKANNFLKRYKGNYKFILPDGNVAVANNTNDLINQITQAGAQVPSELTQPAFKGKEVPTISDEFVKNWDDSPFSATEGLKSNAKLAGEEAVKNYLTNEYGSVGYKQQSPYTRIPFVGQQLDAYMKAKAKEEEEEKIKQDIYDRWRIILER